MKINLSFIIVLFPFLFSACRISEPESGNIPGFILNAPEEKIVPPPALLEISGITLLDSTTLACIEDEDGIIFIYDLVSRDIIKKIPFWGPGDYEGIASVKDTIYVLRSDGFLFEIDNYRKEEPDVTPYPTGIPPSDNEGLCYDRDNAKLLITCKEYSGKGSQSKNRRNIFGFDLKTKRLTDKPVYSFKMDEILEFAERDNPELKHKSGKKGSKHRDIIKFHPSDLAINPVTKKIYILSGIDHAIAVFSKDGWIENFVILNPAIFNQPEGILFLRNGDMLISNEGGNGRPTLLRISHRSD